MSNNDDLSRIYEIQLSRVALTSEENDLILQGFPEDKIVRVTDCFQACVDFQNKLSKKEQPVLKNFMEGPFSLVVSNVGDSIKNSFMVFELKKEENSKFLRGGVITDSDSIQMTKPVIATIPLLEVWAARIEKERARAEKLLNQGSVTRFDVARVEQDVDTVQRITASFFNALSSKSLDKDDVKIGREAVFDSLSSSLSASNSFYNALWGGMETAFEPTCRYIGEQYALGKIN